MKQKFFQKNHAESNCAKEVTTPFLSQNAWIIPHLSPLILQKMSSPKANIEKIQTEYFHILSIFLIKKFSYDILPLGQVS